LPVVVRPGLFPLEFWLHLWGDAKGVLKKKFDTILPICEVLKTMTASSVLQNSRSFQARESKARKLLAELRQMSRISQREEGLLNHAQAAAVLGVSPRRIGELVHLGKLCRYDFLGRTYVSVCEVLDRRNAELKAGRPARSIAEKVHAAAKILGNYDALNATIDAITPEPKKQNGREK